LTYDVLTFIGRFQPFHMGHKAVVDKALTLARTVVLVIGSHNQPRDPRNPFTTTERISMIAGVYPDEVSSGRIQFVAVEDSKYNDHKWVASIQKGVTAVASKLCFPYPAKIGLIGHAKDNTSYYLSIFPQWKDHVSVDNHNGIDATTIRRLFFTIGGVRNVDLPVSVGNWLLKFMLTDDYKAVAAEQDFIVKYKKQWAVAPYPVTFTTVDAVVVVSGHVLLVERGAFPGKGLWAVPGGYLNQDETLINGALRELTEETQIDLSMETLRRCVRSWRTFDDPNRSLRGRTITTAFHIELRNEAKLPKIKGSDDAVKARWVPLSQVNRLMMFEDHYDIIETLVGGVG
jgi:bifunctional NMN adenylyltransferase/nudix hydrolase